jgi:excisionase family DNA binding protein
MFGRTSRTVRSWIQSGRLRRVRVGRSVFIPSTEIERLIPEQARPQGSESS